jgi:hypothetical protein
MSPQPSLHGWFALGNDIGVSFVPHDDAADGPRK